MLTPRSPPCPELPRTNNPPGSDPDRAPRKEPEPDFGEPEQILGPTQLRLPHAMTHTVNGD